jgi:histidinol-phosphate/aromatic aminotransferase/cobyric acid decarboxylase-like protein
VTVLAPGDHGGDGRLVASSLGLEPTHVLDLSVSLNPFAPDVIPIVRRHLDAGLLSRYPDAVDAGRAGAALAACLEVDQDRVLVTNGGAEAIALVAAELGTGWAETEEFSLYRRHLAALDPEGPRFRSDPHNPSGRLAAPSSADAAVWDEAFYPLSTGRWTAPRRADDAIVVGSLTKLFACPGLRVGYVISPRDDGDALGVPRLRDRLARRQPAWAVAPLALAAAPDLLAAASLGAWAEAVAAARRELVGVLSDHGLEPLPSDAPFVLVPGAAGLRTALAQRGVVVRDCASFGLPDHVRIGVPDGSGLARLDAALRAAGVARDATGARP